MSSLVGMEPETGLQFNSVVNSLVGNKGGFTISVKENEIEGCFYVYYWVKEGTPLVVQTLTSFLTAYRLSHSFLKNYTYDSNCLVVILECKGLETEDKLVVSHFIRDITMFLSANEYKNCCADCGNTNGLAYIEARQKPFQLCPQCKERRRSSANTSAPAAQPKSEEKAKPQQNIVKVDEAIVVKSLQKPAETPSKPEPPKASATPVQPAAKSPVSDAKPTVTLPKTQESAAKPAEQTPKISEPTAKTNVTSQKIPESTIVSTPKPKITVSAPQSVTSVFSGTVAPNVAPSVSQPKAPEKHLDIPQNSASRQAPPPLASNNVTTKAVIPPQTKPQAVVPPQTTPQAVVPPQTMPKAVVPPQTMPKAVVTPQTTPKAVVPPQTTPKAVVPPQTMSKAVVPPQTIPKADIPQQTKPKAVVQPQAVINKPVIQDAKTLPKKESSDMPDDLMSLMFDPNAAPEPVKEKPAPTPKKPPQPIENPHIITEESIKKAQPAIKAERVSIDIDMNAKDVTVQKTPVFIPVSQTKPEDYVQPKPMAQPVSMLSNAIQEMEMVQLKNKPAVLDMQSPAEIEKENRAAVQPVTRPVGARPYNTEINATGNDHSVSVTAVKRKSGGNIRNPFGILGAFLFMLIGAAAWFGIGFFEVGAELEIILKIAGGLVIYGLVFLGFRAFAGGVGYVGVSITLIFSSVAVILGELALMMKLIIGFGYEFMQALNILDNYVLSDAYLPMVSLHFLFGFLPIFLLSLVSLIRAKFNS